MIGLGGIDIPHIMRLLNRGVVALERLADAQEQANKLARQIEAPKKKPPNWHGRNEYGDKV